MRLRHIEVFNAVMLTGSVSGAARLINVTQPAVSRTLQHAELQLGLSLFQRVRNRLVPTPEALTLYPHIERLFAQLDEVQRLARTLRAGASADEIRVLSILTLGHEVLPRALALFRAKFPKVRVQFESLHSPQIVSSLALQEADVGFVFGGQTHPALQRESLADAWLVCIAKKGSLPPALLRRGVVTPTELEKLPVIGLPAGDPLGTLLGSWMLTSGDGAENAMPTTAVSVQTYHAALSLARHGHGVAVVDACTALSGNADTVDMLPIAPSVSVPVHALRPAGRAASVPVQAFTRAVQKVLHQALSPG